MTSTSSPRSLYISHGGGPMPLLDEATHGELNQCLRKIAKKIPKPSAILLISAHWEERVPTVTSGINLPLIYDYYGFPEVAYRITYPCPGEPSLAAKVQESFNNTGIAASSNVTRGYDHGVFVPLKIMYPDADIPVVEMSLVHTLDPATHIKIGEALSHLDYDNLLVIGSGFSFHNMRAIFAPDSAKSTAMNIGFEDWLIDTCSNPSLDTAERTQRLINWEKAPYARHAQPREDHLLPLHVCYGMHQTACSESFKVIVGSRQMGFVHASMYLW